MHVEYVDLLFLQHNRYTCITRPFPDCAFSFSLDYSKPRVTHILELQTGVHEFHRIGMSLCNQGARKVIFKAAHWQA